MKISVIFITTMLVAQVSASFFDALNSAVLSVQNSFGKLLGDVVTDVKITVDCTILAVEHVLSLSPDATTRYYEKCGSTTNKTDLSSETSLPKVEVTFNYSNNEEYLQKMIPAEIDAKLNETLSKVLDDHKPLDSELVIENVLNKDSEQLAGVSALIKKELEKLSNEVTIDLKNLEKQKNSEPFVDLILQEIKVLEKREQNSKNASEAYEIHKIFGQILTKLDAIKATEANENIKLEEIMKDLEYKSNNGFVGLEHQFEEWKKEESKHLSEMKNETEDYEKISNKQHVQIFNNTGMNRESVGPTLTTQGISGENATLVEEVLGKKTTPRTVGDSNDQSLLSVQNISSSFQNNTLKERLNDTVITSTSLSTTENLFGREIINPFENATSVGFSELVTFSFTNQSITVQNTLTGYDTKYKNMTNTKFPIPECAPTNETIQPDNKKDSTSVTINEPTIILKNNLTETVVITNPIPTTTTSLDVINRHVPLVISTDPKKDSWIDIAKNNETVKNATGKAEREVTAIAQNSSNNDNANYITVTSKYNSIVDNIPGNATDSANLEISTLTTKEFATPLTPIKNIESNDTILTKSSFSKDGSLPVNETGPVIETSTITAIGESSSLRTEIVGDNDSSTSSTITVNTVTGVTEAIQSRETVTAIGKEKSISSTIKTIDDNDSNDNIETNSSISIDEKTVDESTYLEETSTTPSDEDTTKTLILENDSNNFMPIRDFLPRVEITPPETTVPLKTTTASGESSNSSNDTIITSTSLPLKESISSTETSRAEVISTVSRYKESLMEPTMELANIGNDNNSNDYTITITQTPLISMYESETIQTGTVIECTIEDELLRPAEGNSKEPPNTADHIDENATLTNTPSIRKDNLSTTVSDEPFIMITNAPIVSTTTLINTDCNTDTVTSTTVSKIGAPVETSTLTDNKEYLMFTNSPATVLNEEVTNENTDLSDQVTNTTASNTKNEAAIETIKLITASEKQNSSTSTSALNDTDTAFPPTESIPAPVYSLTAPLETNTSSTPLMTKATIIKFESPSDVPTSISHSYSFDEALGKTGKTPEAVLTTHRPKRTSSHVKKHKTQPMLYDSFFNTQKDAETHQRALKEARQLIANGKRSKRIINNIMKNNKYQARSKGK